MSEKEALNIPVGCILNQRYEVVRALGTGSMGVVYCCKDQRSEGRLVAMKILFEELAKDRVGVQRFRNEIIAAYKAVHRNVVQPFDYFEEDNLVAYTMEFVDGEDLAGILSSKEAIDIPNVVNCMMEMCRGVQAIHSTGIIHRDLKPENVMLAKSGEIKIMDFGIAKSLDGKKLTEHGALLGTVEYMSPEYLADGTVNPLGDIYSLGVIGYELVTGLLPHRGAGVLEVIDSKFNKSAVPPHEIRADCPIVLSKMILKAMHSDSSKRYQSARAFLQDLVTLGYQTGVRIPTAELKRQHLDDLAAEALAETDDAATSSKPEPWSMIDEASETPLSTGELTDVAGSVPVRTSQRRVTSLAVLLILGITFLSYETILQRLSDFERSLYGVEMKPSTLVGVAQRCDFEKAQKMPPEGLDPNERDSSGTSALAWAVRENCLPMVNFLIERGADLNAVDVDGMTPLQSANEKGLQDVENLLLHYGATSVVEEAASTVP